jgi:hypothetical protein
LPPKNAETDITQNLIDALEKKIFRKCTEESNYILGNIRIIYRPATGKINSLAINQVPSIYPLFYQAKSICIRESDIIYNAIITTVTPNEIIFSANDCIDGVIIPVNLEPGFQKKYTEGQRVSVKVLSVEYVKNRSTITVTGDVYNLITISETFRKIHFHRNIFSEISATLEKSQHVNTYFLVEPISKPSVIPKMHEYFRNFLLGMDQLTTELGMSQENLEWIEILTIVFPLIASDTNFTFDKKYPHRDALIEMTLAHAKKCNKMWAYAKEEKNTNSAVAGNLVINNSTITEYTLDSISASAFEESVIIKMTLDITNIDIMYLYLLTGIYYHVIMYIPEAIDFENNTIYLICLHRTNTINYELLKNTIKKDHSIFKTGSLAYKYLETQMIDFLTNLKQLKELFRMKIKEVSADYNYKIPPINAKPQDRIHVEKENFVNSYKKMHFTFPEKIVEIDTTQKEDESEYYTDDSTTDSYTSYYETE